MGKGKINLPERLSIWTALILVMARKAAISKRVIEKKSKETIGTLEDIGKGLELKYNEENELTNLISKKFDRTTIQYLDSFSNL